MLLYLFKLDYVFKFSQQRRVFCTSVPKHATCPSGPVGLSCRWFWNLFLGYWLSWGATAFMSLRLWFYSCRAATVLALIQWHSSALSAGPAALRVCPVLPALRVSSFQMALHSVLAVCIFHMRLGAVLVVDEVLVVAVLPEGLAKLVQLREQMQTHVHVHEQVLQPLSQLGERRPERAQWIVTGWSHTKCKSFEF